MTQHIINNTVSQFLGREYIELGFVLVELDDHILELLFKDAHVDYFTYHAAMGEIQASARHYLEGLTDVTQ